MNDSMVLIILIVVAALSIILPIVYTKCNINNTQLFDMLKNVFNILGTINKNLDYQYKDIMQLIIDYSKLAVEYAEQLYLNGTITKEERKNVAIDYVYKALDVQKIEITEDMKHIISASIEAAVYLLPPTEDYETTIDEREV